QAVADCITETNEFKFKNKQDVIIFDVEAKYYTAENWNAVVLWNYLHVLKWNYLNNSNMSKDEVFEEVRRRICDQYPTKGVKDLEGQLNKAISDIKEYDKELSLADEMKEFYSIARNTKGKSFKEIIQNNPMLAPNADWSMEKSIEKDTERQHLQKKKNVSEEDIDWVDFENTSLRSHNFTPIKIKADNTIYFINMYTFCMPLKSSLGDLECCLYYVSKDKSLKGMSWSSEEWKNSLIPDKSILDTIQTQIQELFKDIIKSKDIRIQ
ncbi:MAG: hypothetical protein IJS10_00850, partial [Alphaproteobacteria bacterium]|nr:hypothetical protein [Alphaproteobacteria bacterium]